MKTDRKLQSCVMGHYGRIPSVHDIIKKDDNVPPKLPSVAYKNSPSIYYLTVKVHGFMRRIIGKQASLDMVIFDCLFVSYFTTQCADKFEILPEHFSYNIQEKSSDKKQTADKHIIVLPNKDIVDAFF